jgi:ABC-2 type transport system permease protein
VLRAVVRRGLLDNRRAALVWGGPLGVMGALVLALYPSIRRAFAGSIQGFPDGLKQAFGITDFATVEQYLNAEMFSLFLPLAAAYVAMRCVASAIAGAEEHGDLDCVLATPLARRTLVAGAFATAAITVAGVLLVAGALTEAGGLLVGETVAVGRLGAALAGVWALALFFAGVATLAAGLLHRAATVLGTGAGLLAAMYLVDVLGKLAGGLGWLRAISAFRWYGTPLEDGLDVPGLVLLVVAAALLAAAGAACYERRDIA